MGIELSGNPNVGKFEEFIPSFMKAREAGLKVVLINRWIALDVFPNMHNGIISL